MICTVSIVKEDETYIAKDLQTCVVSQGNTPEVALDNLREALELYYEGTDVDEAYSPMYTTTLDLPKGQSC